MVFHWSYNKTPQILRALLSILADLNNTVFWIVSILPLVSNSLNPLSKALWTVPSAPTTIGIIVTLMFYNNFFLFLWQGRSMSIFLLSLIFTLWSVGTAKPTKGQFLFFLSFFFFLFIDTVTSLLFVSFSRTDSGLCIYYLVLFTPWEFFTSALVSLSLQDSSQYSGRTQQCCSMDSLHPCRYFQVLQSLYQSFGDCTNGTSYNWYNRHFHVPQFVCFFNSLAKSKYLSFFSHSFNNSTLWSAGTAKSTIRQVLSFLL